MNVFPLEIYGTILTEDIVPGWRYLLGYTDSATQLFHKSLFLRPPSVLQSLNYKLKNCRTLDVFPSWRPADH
jgi:hypothetical protein